MSQDPYGFPDAAPSGGAGDDASRAMWLSLSAALLGSVGICFCYVPYLVALPLGIYGAYLGSRALSAAVEEKSKAMATAGLVGGILSGLVSGMFALFFLLYALMAVVYVFIIAAAIAAAAADGGGGGF
ncbi:MAG: hypothetical protein Q8P41_19295 [Pseudomonadota bacterium]|nr:hypothetical protein [Pseudomonadota bacterium]